MKTYLTFYQNEQRAVELTIRDQDDVPYVPSNVYASITEAVSGSTVLAEAVCMLTSNVAYMFVPHDVTDTIGRYDIVWRIVKENLGSDTYTFYHKTALMVEEI
jgi:hypothetical protein